MRARAPPATLSRMIAWVLIAATAVVAIGFAVRSYLRNQERIAALASLAASKGWTFSPVDPYGLPQRWGGAAPFDRGYDRAAENVVMGDVDGRPMVAFDYSYKEDTQNRSDGNSSTTTHQFSVVAVGLPCALPEVEVTPEGVLAKIGQALGMRDIELESDDFNRRFRVRCGDPKLAVDLLPPRTMELLLRYPDRLRLRIAGADVVSHADGCLEPADLLNRSAVLSGLVGNVPAFVWKDYGLGDRTPTTGNLT